MMSLAQLDGFLDLQLSNEDVAHPKPDPEIYNKAMAYFGLGPSECLIVEDNEHGIAAAQASGAHVMAVRSPEDVTHERLMAAIRAAESKPQRRAPGRERGMQPVPKRFAKAGRMAQAAGAR